MSNQTLDYHKSHPNLPWIEAEALQLQLRTVWAVEAILDHLESQQTSATPATDQPAPSSSVSSVPTTGHAEKRSPSLGANPDSMFLCGRLMEAITDFFKSTPYTLPVLAVTWPDSSTLKLTLEWPIDSGTTTVGSRGPAVLEMVEWMY